jgi:hypothetical protein
MSCTTIADNHRHSKKFGQDLGKIRLHTTAICCKTPHILDQGQWLHLHAVETLQGQLDQSSLT